MEGCATILSAAPKMATSWVVPPLHVMAMRSTLSGMANSLPFASTTVPETVSGAWPSAGFGPSSCCAQPPNATVPVAATPAAASSSTKRLRVSRFMF